MVLTVSCKICKSQIRLKRTALDRVELAKTYGKEFALRCPKCSNESTYQVNEVKASKSKFNIVIVLLSIALEILVFYGLLGVLTFQNVQAFFVYPVALSVIPLTFFVWLINEQKTIHNFNKHRL
jgi:hypothetical protein